MGILASRMAAALAIGAACSMTTTPAMARGWGDHRWHGRDSGIDGGDILAGVLILGGIAAIATAAGKSNRERREADYRYPERDYRDGRDDAGYADDREAPADYSDRDTRGDARQAVDSCVDAVERGDARVDAVEAVNGDGDGWRVEGRATGGRDFSCSVDRDGQIRGIAMDSVGR